MVYLVPMGGVRFALPRQKVGGPPFFTKNQMTVLLEQVATLLTLKGANSFRVRAYQNASRTLSSLTDDFIEMVETGEIFNLKGIGKGIGNALCDAVIEGNLGDWATLYAETPKGLLEMLQIPGLGPIKVKRLYDELGIDSNNAVRVFCENGEVAKLDGFGEKSQKKIIEGLELLTRFSERRRLNTALAYGERLLRHIAAIPGVERCELAGSLRRRRESVGDLDLVVAVNDENLRDVRAGILSLPGIAAIKGAGDTKISLILDTGILEDSISLGDMDADVLEGIGGSEYEKLEVNGTIDAQARLVPIEVYPFTLAYFTGSKEHNVALRQRASILGYRLNEFGLVPLELIEDGKGAEIAKYSLPCRDEEEIYSNLKLAFVPPEMREDTGEVELAASQFIDGERMPRLLEADDLLGCLHNHTTLSDGSNTLEEMAEAAMRMGWRYLGIADHSQSLKVARGASVKDLQEQGNNISLLNERWRREGVDFVLLHGSEVDIGLDGGLDYPNEVLAELDYVVASVHQPLSVWRGRNEEENTEVLLKVIENRHVSVLGHPTGRLLQSRDGYPVDMMKILGRMGELNSKGVFKAIELNASPYRLDLDWRLLRFASQMGVPVSISPDAHSAEGLTDIRYGLAMGRKGWLLPKHLVNSLPVNELLERLKAR